MRISILLCGILMASVCSAAIFKWTDENGVVHFSNGPVSETAGQRFKKIEVDSRPSGEVKQEDPEEDPEAQETEGVVVVQDLPVEEGSEEALKSDKSKEGPKSGRSKEGPKNGKSKVGRKSYESRGAKSWSSSGVMTSRDMADRAPQAPKYNFSGWSVSIRNGSLRVTGRVEGGQSCDKLVVRVVLNNESGSRMRVMATAEDVGSGGSRIVSGTTRYYAQRSRWEVFGAYPRC